MGSGQVQVQVEYGAGADHWFWLRQSPDGDQAADGARACLAEALSGVALSSASSLADVTVAAIRSGGGGGDLAAFAEQLPDEVAGMALKDTLRLVSACLEGAPEVPAGRRGLVEDRLEELDLAALGVVCDWVADRLGFVLPGPVTFKVVAVADGVPLSGVTGHLNGRPWSFVSVLPHPGSTLAEMVVHEVTHALDLVRTRETPSVIDALRDGQPPTSQSWHVPFFLLAAEGIRQFVNPDHQDYGDTHGYYRKVSEHERKAAQERLGL